jgi:hypothetical protein
MLADHVRVNPLNERPGACAEGLGSFAEGHDAKPIAPEAIRNLHLPRRQLNEEAR